ncbi:MAG: hypothetical protein GXP45_07380 [bacterium]|nr:hypothetical protein [bacterium]
MCVIRSFKDQNKVKGKLHEKETKVQFLYYDQAKNISTLKICISRGIRHQIRVHLASL